MASLIKIMSSRVCMLQCTAGYFSSLCHELYCHELPRPDITGITPQFLTALCLEMEELLFELNPMIYEDYFNRFNIAYNRWDLSLFYQ